MENLNIKRPETWSALNYFQHTFLRIKCSCDDYLYVCYVVHMQIIKHTCYRHRNIIKVLKWKNIKYICMKSEVKIN